MKVECFVVNCPFVLLKENCAKALQPKKKKKFISLPPYDPEFICYLPFLNCRR